MPSCTLVMDTSASPLLLAVEKEGKTFIAHRKGIKQEKLLFPTLQKLLAKAGATLQDVKRICIIRGPGRFTGIRIALTFASMMQLLNKSEVYGATLFEVLYQQAVASPRFQQWQGEHPAGAIAVVLHAFREEYFLQFFDKHPTPPQWLSREELLATLKAHNAPLFVVGTDRDFLPLSGLLPNAYTLADYKDCRVQAHTLVNLGKNARYKTQALEPLYLKPARFELTEPK